ncbi:CubicO group peptidase (beta-lactamase class C family) [Nocardiopsis sp. Huas11]|uniref:serine hydrolase domain-containing protein n=1 Tax=Nocardiopsis sp. Huas11 TaxID=2183912 RepID=UPI000EB2A43E|nr:serine hydrolase domain-containing protein [Nocardiopsis sp. Huas11]RKS04708.1 CubicO group peptidase (beta-lactamase class C family) [Nocardiopsis sp. Huas11]
MRSRPLTVAAACAAAALMVVLGLLVRPHTPALSSEESGDPGLLDRARPLFAEGVHHRVSVVEIDGSSTRVAHFGADDATSYEVGSFSKALTGLLLAEMVERGEVDEDTELGELLELDGAPAASVTLAELSAHRSGLPRLSPRPRDAIGAWVATVTARDPYRFDVDTLVEQVAAAETSGRGEFTYSNLGAAVLGQALAARAGTDYADLLRARVLDPLDLDATVLPATAADLPAGAIEGTNEKGRSADPWLAGAYAPAGGVRSTPADMAALARALLFDDPPGARAMEPRWDDGEDGGVGLGWFVDDHGGTDVTWHNGGTGGFATMLALDREGGRAVVVLADTATGVESQARDLLLGEA